MEIKKIRIERKGDDAATIRPWMLVEFIGQDEIKRIIQTAVSSAKQVWHPLGHILFSGESGHGKTTLAQIIAKELGVNIKIVTGYAITKPSELISILNNVEKWDILFIDEIHRLKPNIEEILYIAMEDFVIDMVMPEGGNVRIPINPFTLIGATTKMESIAWPLKNRFVYKFHFNDYSQEEKIQIIRRYMKLYFIDAVDSIISMIEEKVESTPREIHNFIVKIRDYLISHSPHDGHSFDFDESFWADFSTWVNIDKWGLTSLHKKYLDVLSEHDTPVGVKTIAAKLWVSEKSIEEDIEPLLLKLGKIEKTTKGRVKI